MFDYEFGILEEHNKEFLQSSNFWKNDKFNSVLEDNTFNCLAESHENIFLISKDKKFSFIEKLSMKLYTHETKSILESNIDLLAPDQKFKFLFCCATDEVDKNKKNVYALNLK